MCWRISPRSWGLVTVCLVLAPGLVTGSGPYDGPNGSELTIEDGIITEVNGPGNWIIWGVGQDVTVNLKNGPGSLTLRGFKNITINKKDGPGKLIVEGDNETVTIKDLNGPGDSYLRCKGRKKIEKWDGPGNVHFRGSPPIVLHKNGPGTTIRDK